MPLWVPMDWSKWDNDYHPLPIPGRMATTKLVVLMVTWFKPTPQSLICDPSCSFPTRPSTTPVCLIGVCIGELHLHIQCHLTWDQFHVCMWCWWTTHMWSMLGCAAYLERGGLASMRCFHMLKFHAELHEVKVHCSWTSARVWWECMVAIEIWSGVAKWAKADNFRYGPTQHLVCPNNKVSPLVPHWYMGWWTDSFPSPIWFQHTPSCTTT